VSSQLSNDRSAGLFNDDAPRGDGRLPGLVLRAQSGFFWVETAQGVLECRLRGRLKREQQASDLAVIGDHVLVMPTGNGQGAVEEVLPRRSQLARQSAGKRGAYKADVLVANVDQVLLVFACAAPAFAPRMLDRYLVTCAHNGLTPLIVASKTDLVGRDAARALFAEYERIGYDVAYTSLNDAASLQALRERLHSRISVVTGKSGVGKSSLLNALYDGLGLAVGAVSGALNKGRHTTTVAELLPLAAGGYVADTPGIREIGLWDIAGEDLDWCYVEFRPFLDDCYFSGCTHLHEPDCAVRAAVSAGAISAERYDSYCRLRRGDA
jgi:ribosome biogenesis GTPase / thiamine phosphate phosphatase